MAFDLSTIATSRFFDFFKKLKEWQLFLGLFAYAFFIRSPFFFRDYIDRDESTFILMGQSWAEGHLPYTELWDLKPPVTFLFFAGIIYLFGKSFVAIRLAGVLLVTISALSTYKIANDLKGKMCGIVSGILVVLLFSLFGSLQGVMSEHICMAFFMPAVYLFIKNKNSFQLAMAGLLFGMALMSKLNIGYPLVSLFLTVLWLGIKEGTFKKRFLDLLVCGTSICAIIFLTSLPYLITEQAIIWWNSVVKAPLAYSSSEHNSALRALPFVVLVLSFLLLIGKKRLLDTKHDAIVMMLAITFGVLFSFLQTGKANGHYLIQLYPFLVIFIVGAFSGFTIFKSKIMPRLFMVLLILIPIESYAEMANIIKSKKATGSLFNGEGIAVPNYFKENNLDTHSVFFLEYHIGYWLMNAKPPTKAATHPSNILRQELFPYMHNKRLGEGEELKYILESLKPSYIVTRKNRRVFYSKMYTANFYIQLKLLEEYHPIDTIQNAVIHQRLPIEQ